MATDQPNRAFAVPDPGHSSLGSGVRLALWLAPVGLAALLILGQPDERRPRAAVALAAVAVAWKGLVSGVRVAAQWERGVILRLGNLQGVRGPGIFYVIPVLESVRFLDVRTLVLNIPQQKVITRDNVPASIDSAVFFRVNDASRAITTIQDYRFAIAQYSQAALRDVVGGLSLDELLSERERIQEQVQAAVESQAHQWGISIESIQLQDIELPEDLKRTMSRQASAEREKRATITKADGDRLAAENLARAAATMAANPIALELRTLQTIDGLGASPSNPVVLFPLELSRGLNALLRRTDEPPST